MFLQSVYCLFSVSEGALSGTSLNNKIWKLTSWKAGWMTITQQRERCHNCLTGHSCACMSGPGIIENCSAAWMSESEDSFCLVITIMVVGTDSFWILLLKHENMICTELCTQTHDRNIPQLNGPVAPITDNQSHIHYQTYSSWMQKVFWEYCEPYLLLTEVLKVLALARERTVTFKNIQQPSHRL